MTDAAREAPRSVQQLEDRLSEPREETIAALRDCPGDVIVLGAGGKMGPTLAHMVARAARRADGSMKRRVFAASRFSSDAAEMAITYAGISTIRANLLDLADLDRLPDVPNVIFMAGQKFGTSGAPGRTWMLNGALPALVAHRYRRARIVAFSTGNVYPLVPVDGGGATERTPTAPVGDYAASCVVREHAFRVASAAWKTPVAIVRLNYAVDLRYGVLTDIALKVQHDAPVDLTMGRVNVIWQGDANRYAIELLPLADSPPSIWNVSGVESLSVRTLATELGARLGKSPQFTGTENPDALLTNTSKVRSALGEPSVKIGTLLDWVADWVRSDMPLLNKPTHFESRSGAF
jgi:hypothetical protein